MRLIENLYVLRLMAEVDWTIWISIISQAYLNVEQISRPVCWIENAIYEGSLVIAIVE